MTSQIKRRIASLLLLSLTTFLAPSAKVFASSIFDDDAGWDDPARDVPRQHTTAPKKTTSKPKDPPKAQDPLPESEPDHTAPPIVPETVEAANPAQQSLSAAIPDAKAMLKSIEAQLKALGGMKLEDEKVVHLVHTRAVCYLMLGDLPSAKKTMEMVLKSKFTNRSIVLNAARIDIASNINAPRAMISLAAYLSKSPTDEEAFTLYGSSLAANARRNKKKAAPLPQDKIDLYMKTTADMESSHPGQKRWGNDWMDTGEYNRMMTTREAALRDLDEVWRRYLQASDNERQVVAENRPYKQGNHLVYMPYEIEAINRAEDQTDEAYAKVKGARTKVVKPRWAYSMIPVTPDPKLQLGDKAAAAAAAAAAKEPAAKIVAADAAK